MTTLVAPAVVEGRAAEPSPRAALWRAGLERLQDLPERLDPFLALAVWDRRPTLRTATHVALLLRFATGGPAPEHPTLAALSAALTALVSDPRLPRLVDRKIGEIAYFAWLTSLRRGRPDAVDLSDVLASRLRHPHPPGVERTAHGRFLLAWHVRALGLDVAAGSPADYLDELAPFRRRLRFLAGLDEALEILELSVLVAGARHAGLGWQRELAGAPPLAGLGDLVEGALAVLLRGEEALPLAAMLASSHLLDAGPPLLRRLALRRLCALWTGRSAVAEGSERTSPANEAGAAGVVVALAAGLAETGP